MLSLTRREPAILRVISCGNEELETVSLVVLDAGLSASLSRLLEFGGLDFGRGKSPANANSYRMSLWDDDMSYCYAVTEHMSIYHKRPAEFDLEIRLNTLEKSKPQPLTEFRSA